MIPRARLYFSSTQQHTAHHHDGARRRDKSSCAPWRTNQPTNLLHHNHKASSTSSWCSRFVCVVPNIFLASSSSKCRRDRFCFSSLLVLWLRLWFNQRDFVVNTPSISHIYRIYTKFGNHSVCGACAFHRNVMYIINIDICAPNTIYWSISSVHWNGDWNQYSGVWYHTITTNGCWTKCVRI